jgi:hypothetical protein
MKNKTRLILAATVVLQVIHSIEEYSFEFYNVFPPAKYLNSIFPGIARPGFIAINILVIGYGVFCFMIYPKTRESTAKGIFWIWIWVGVEAFNGLGHLIWGILIFGYDPGMVSGILFIPLVSLLIFNLSKEVDNHYLPY